MACVLNVCGMRVPRGPAAKSISRQEADRNVAKFSRGMQQRIGLAQALINDPELLILDEPTSALDPLARVAMRELLLEANSAGKTIFLSSHLLSEIEMICHRVAILDKGRLVKVGRTEELLVSRDRYEIVARGIAADRFRQLRTASMVESSSRLRLPRSAMPWSACGRWAARC